MKLYKVIANILSTYNNKIINNDIKDNIEDEMEELSKNFLPYYSEANRGCVIDIDHSNEDKIVILCDYHTLHKDGYYTGWDKYKIIVTPSLSNDYNIKIYGKNKNAVKQYFIDIFDKVLNQEIIMTFDYECKILHFTSGNV